MLPLFEGLNVETNPPVPVGGVGIFHKGADDYAGFISPRLFPLDYETTLDNYAWNSWIDTKVKAPMRESAEYH